MSVITPSIRSTREEHGLSPYVTILLRAHKSCRLEADRPLTVGRRLCQPAAIEPNRSRWNKLLQAFVGLTTNNPGMEERRFGMSARVVFQLLRRRDFSAAAAADHRRVLRPMPRGFPCMRIQIKPAPEISPTAAPKTRAERQSMTAIPVQAPTNMRSSAAAA